MTKNFKSNFFCNICLHNLSILQYFLFTLFKCIMQITARNNFNNNVSFSGLKQEKILAEGILRDYKSNFPYFKSNSFVNTKILAHYKSPRYASINDKLYDLSAKYTTNIRMIREILTKDYKFESFTQFISVLKLILLQRGYANCAELNYILQDCFLKRNVNAHMVCLDTFYKKSANKVSGKDHCFIVFNLDKNAKLDNPATWGNKAIIADAWANIVMPAYDALNYYKKILSYNQSKEYQLFRGCDKVKIVDNIR